MELYVYFFQVLDHSEENELKCWKVFLIFPSKFLSCFSTGTTIYYKDLQCYIVVVVIVLALVIVVIVVIVVLVVIIVLNLSRCFHMSINK